MLFNLDKVLEKNAKERTGYKYRDYLLRRYNLTIKSINPAN